MTTTQDLIKSTERFTGEGTVISACTTGFMMIEMASNDLARKVANVWINADMMNITVKDNKVYAF